MPPIRVLTVDDAVVVRRLLADALATEQDIQIIGTAANGRIALQKIAQNVPDVVTMDVEMPEMDGIETVRQIRKTWPALPVIMFSTLTERGAGATLDALAAGASDYVTKPANVGSITAGLERIREQLVPRIRALAQRGATAAQAPARPVAAEPVRPIVSPPLGLAGPAQRIDVVAIGTSTGGPNALNAVVPALPADLGVPLLIVQHMPPVFTRLLADRLNQQSPFTVVEAQNGMAVLPGHAYVAPGDFHMAVRRVGQAIAIELSQDAPEHSCRPAVDVLFRSVARTYGNRALGVVMTGMGQDGLAGSRAMKEAGAAIAIQDEATSVVWGMPGFVARASLADVVLPLSSIAPEIDRRVRAGAWGRPRPVAPAPASSQAPAPASSSTSGSVAS